MKKCNLAAVLTFSIIFGVWPAFGQETGAISPAAEDFVQKGISATLDASCNKLLPPAKCRNGHLILSANDQEELQGQEFDGMSIGHKSGTVVMCTVTKAKWPVYKGLRVGTSREKVLQVLGAPSERRSDGEDDSAEILYWAPGESSAKFAFDKQGLVTEVTWELYYD